MDDTDLRIYIVQRLAHGVAENDVILEVCQTSGLPWPEAKSLVTSTASEEGTAITNRQFPVLALLSSASISAGLALIVWFATALVEPLRTVRVSRGESGIIDLATLAVWMTTNLYFMGDLVLGSAMIAGGLIGLRRAGIRTFPRL